MPSHILGPSLGCVQLDLGPVWHIISPTEVESGSKIPLGIGLADKALAALFWCEGALSK